MLMGSIATIGFLLAASVAAQTTVITFDNGWEDWIGPVGLKDETVIQPTGGNPGAHAYTALEGLSTFAFRTDANTNFIGNLSQNESITLSIDLKVENISFFGNPQSRSLIAEFRSYSLGQDGPWSSVWYELTLMHSGQDWATYSVTFDPRATALPAGWHGAGAEDPVTYDPVLPDGVRFTDVMAQTEELAFTTAKPGTFSGLADFKVRVDNIRIEKHAGSGPAQPPQYRIVDLGDFGGDLANAQGINDAGHVVGTASASNQETLPFLWRNGALTDLGSLLPNVTSGHGVARAISNNGIVAGYSMAPMPGTPQFSVSHAFVWSEANGMIDLTPDSSGMSIARGVNSAGQVVGEGTSTAGAFIWSAQTGMTRINLPDGDGGGQAEAISETGFVTGWQWTTSNELAGWVYDSNTGSIRKLGHLGRPRSQTRGINAAGKVVGYSATPEFKRSVLWLPDDSMIDLGNMPIPDWSQGQANAINDNDWIVGTDDYDQWAEITTKGWLWIEGQKHELKGLIADPAVQAEWDELPHPLGINNRGEIVGIGIHNGVPGRAFLMRPLPTDVIFANGFE
jgi:probable HAF family extracellular repeat protein